MVETLLGVSSPVEEAEVGVGDVMMVIRGCLEIEEGMSVCIQCQEVTSCSAVSYAIALCQFDCRPLKGLRSVTLRGQCC